MWQISHSKCFIIIPTVSRLISICWSEIKPMNSYNTKYNVDLDRISPIINSNKRMHDICCCSTRTHYPDSEPTSLLFSLYCCVFCGEATHTNFIVFGLTRWGLEPMIYRTPGEYANHYSTDAVHEWYMPMGTSVSTIINGN
jgi:hypothetical protein